MRKIKNPYSNLLYVAYQFERGKHKRSIKAPEYKSWEQDITELERYFKTAILPKGPVKLNQAMTITNVPMFINSHLALIKVNKGYTFTLPYLERLQELKKLLIPRQGF